MNDYTLEDVLPPNILKAYAENYERIIMEDMRNKPHIEVGMMVALYSNYDRDVRLGTGIVKHMQWSRHFCKYVCEVQIGNVVMYGISIDRLERQVFNNPYSLLKNRVIQGGLHDE